MSNCQEAGKLLYLKEEEKICNTKFPQVSSLRKTCPGKSSQEEISLEFSPAEETVKVFSITRGSRPLYSLGKVLCVVVETPDCMPASQPPIYQLSDRGQVLQPELSPLTPQTARVPGPGMEWRLGQYQRS